MEIWGDGNGSRDGESQPSSSDSGQVLALSKRIMEEVRRSGGGEGKTIIITIVQQGNGVIEDVRQVELQSSEDNLLAGGTRKKALQLKFFGEVPDTVRTGTVLTSKTGECFKLVLVDSETGDTVDCVPESSAEAEIVVLLDGKNDMTRENFERRIIKTGEKKKPHFVKRVYINLKEGVGYLRDVKLGQESDWTKKCKCRLGARVGQSLYAWTQPFEIIDKRDKDNEKHFPPKLSSEVWRLVRICRDGKPCKRLTGKNIKTLGDFLFWYYVNRQGLEQILLDGGSGDSKWNAIVAHAETCTTDDQRMHYDDDPRMYCHKSPNEPQTSIVYNFVGKLKGVIQESHFVPVDNLSAHEKKDAYELLSSVLKGSAFVERHNTPFDIEASLTPYGSSREVNASSLQPLSEYVYQATEQGSSSQSIDPNTVCDSVSSHSRASQEMGELCNPADLDHEKHETPSLFDQVSCLVNICKGGEIHKSLQVKGINTVEEFLIRLLIDEEEIRQIVRLEEEEWKATVSNTARACSTGYGKYCYTSLKLKKGVVFNLLGDVLGLLSPDKHFHPTDTLSEYDKGEAGELLASARKNWMDVVPYNEPYRPHYQLSFSPGSNFVEHQNEPFDSAVQEFCDAFISTSPNPMFHYAEDTWPQYGAYTEPHPIFDYIEDPWPQYGAYTKPHPLFDYIIEEDPWPQDGAYTEPHVIISTRNGPKGWKLVKFVVCVPKWWFSITMRVPQVTRKRKSQCAALQQSSRVRSCLRTV